MARYKMVDRSPRLLPIVLDAQLMTGSFEYALDYLIDTEIDLSGIAKRYRNDETGAPAYDPAVLLKIVLLAYSRGIVSSRAIERLCRENVLFMAIRGTARRSSRRWQSSCASWERRSRRSSRRYWSSATGRD